MTWLVALKVCIVGWPSDKQLSQTESSSIAGGPFNAEPGLFDYRKIFSLAAEAVNAEQLNPDCDLAAMPSMKEFTLSWLTWAAMPPVRISP